MKKAALVQLCLAVLAAALTGAANWLSVNPLGGPETAAMVVIVLRAVDKALETRAKASA